MFLTDFIIGNLEDNIHIITSSYEYIQLGLPTSSYHLQAITNSQPLIEGSVITLGKVFSTILIYNLLILITFLLNFYSAYILNKKFLTPGVSIVIAVIYSISPFLIFKSQNHPTLFACWLINIGLLIIFKADQRLKYSILLGCYISLVTLASNYFGYFLLLTFSIYNILKISMYYWHQDWQNTFKTISNTILTYSLSLSLILILLWPYVSANFLGNNTTNRIGEINIIVDNVQKTIRGTDWQIIPNTKINNTSQLYVNRSIEDFTYFTSRPWYYVLPPKSNPFFGEFTGKVIDYMQSIPGNWLAQNYFMREHSASYLGWANIILAIIGLFYLKKNPKIFRQNQLILILITIFVLFLFTMPPYFTISGNKIYMPSYLLYLVFPMFRSLTRLGIVILPLFMIFVGYGYQYLFSLRKKYIGITIASIFFIFTIAEFVVPIKITPADYKAGLFIKLNDDLPKDAVLAFLPEEDSNIIVFNINRLKRPVINPKGYNALEFGFNAETFTDNLTTCKGILEARNLGVTHILVYGRSDKQYTKQRDFLRTSNLIQASAYYPADFSEIFTIKMDIDYQKEKEACLKIMDQTN